MAADLIDQARNVVAEEPLEQRERTHEWGDERGPAKTRKTVVLTRPAFSGRRTLILRLALLILRLALLASLFLLLGRARVCLFHSHFASSTLAVFSNSG